jgi:N-acyl-D-amino-acid deacylase
LGDVVIAGECIVYVGKGGASRFAARRTIDAAGKIVAPGFIDPHTPPDTYIRSQDWSQRRNLPWLMQGVTTIAIGVDGSGTPDVANERKWFEERGVGANLVPVLSNNSNGVVLNRTD